MTLFATPWRDSLLTLPFKYQLPGLLRTGLLALLLNSCTSLPSDPALTASADYQRVLTRMENWSLRGRLNIRSEGPADTININWQQNEDEFEINLSGMLGLGAVRISGNSGRVIIEKAGDEPIVASSLQEISSDILGYAFPTSSLLYWIKGLPAPGSSADINRNAEGLVATLSQADRQGTHWELQYDRYENHQGFILPGRIRMEQSPYRLTFLVNDWDVQGTEGDSD